MIYRNIAEGLIFNLKGEVLMQKKTIDYPTWPGGCWTFFGGTIEENEEPIDAVKREVEEELGIVIEEDSIELFMEDDYEIEDNSKGRRYNFVIKIDIGVEDIKLKEGGGFGFFDKSELKDIKIIPHDKIILEKYFREKI
jgi:8-oxo-dGTP diphosphatase